MVEGASDTRMEEKKQGDVGLYRWKHCRNKRNSLGSFVGREQYNSNVEEMDQVAAILVVDLAKAFENVQLNVVWAWAMHFCFLQIIILVFCGYFSGISVGCFLKDVWQMLFRPRPSYLARNGRFCS